MLKIYMKTCKVHNYIFYIKKLTSFKIVRKSVDEDEMAS